ncbi:hypothetical protein B9Z55_025900 [Caenorhabditis nigoni]|uniref:Uncharacterized protein n=1 Tax=Caenorhabditis nigoni TaxID=1611254 RepID=A0A2G5T0Q7_9PELO|nr:hypothetical protein B9Z55_025900 [Caenorhabditis nigoni]
MAKKRSITSLPVIYKHSFVIWGALVLFAPLLFVRDAHEKSTKSHQQYPIQENFRQNEAVENAVSYVAAIFLHNNFRLRHLRTYHFDTENEILVNCKKRSKSSTHLM